MNLTTLDYSLKTVFAPMEGSPPRSPADSQAPSSASTSKSTQKGHPSQTTKLNSRAIVERCFLINLDRRPDRLREWLDQLPDPWPFPEPERFAAIDGRNVATPPQWRAGIGAWGCYRSHLLILEKCLSEHIDSYVVFEDDAGFAEDFAEQLNEFVDELPPDWGLAYLGVQYLYAGEHPPQKVSEHVYCPTIRTTSHPVVPRRTICHPVIPASTIPTCRPIRSCFQSSKTRGLSAMIVSPDRGHSCQH